MSILTNKITATALALTMAGATTGVLCNNMTKGNNINNNSTVEQHIVKNNNNDVKQVSEKVNTIKLSNNVNNKNIPFKDMNAKFSIGCDVPPSFIPNWTYGNHPSGWGSYSAFVDNSGTGLNNGVYRLYLWFNSSSYGNWANICWDAYVNGYALTICYYGNDIISVSI